jgi:integrase
VFTRAFGTKDKKVVAVNYGTIHAEAEAYFARLISGRSLTDREIEQIILRHPMADAMVTSPRSIQSRLDLDRFIDTHGDAEVRALAGPDRERLKQAVDFLNGKIEAGHLMALERKAEIQRAFVSKRFGTDAVPPKTTNTFTLKDAYEQAWVPAKDRGQNTVVEIGRYVDEFEALNGKLDLKEYTREHWASWRKDCLDKHGPGPTAFKRFSMMKTIVNESMRAGLFERKNFAGQDVTMRKPKSKKLRNEGWLADELVTWFSAPLFKGAKTSPRPDADYWISVIIAHTGARLSEVAGMQTLDVAERHGLWTFFLAKEHGKTEDSRRVIPISRQIIDLGFLRYLKTRPKDGPLFEDVSAKLMSQTYARMRGDLGLTRKGCDVHAHRHHVKTLLSDLHCPDRVSDYVTGHAPPSVSGRYGKTELTTALKFLDQIDLGVKIPKWKAL